MTSSRSACCQSEPASWRCVWCKSSFADGRLPPSRTENDPYIWSFRELNSEENNTVCFFMRDKEEPDDCSSKADLVNDFCFGAAVTPQEWRSKATTDEGDNELLKALVIDSSNDGMTAKSRTNPGGLTAGQLYGYLSTMVRFKLPHKVVVVAENDAISEAWAVKQDDDPLAEEPDADRRLLFVTDLDCSTVLAIIRTAPVGLAEALRDTIYNHLAFKTSISANVSSDGLPSFRFSFDLSYFALRESETATEDLPRRGDGKGLRSYEDVTFLVSRPRSKTSGATESTNFYIYEAHSSGVVWGTGNHRWEAVAFQDTFFDNEESIEEYEFHPDLPGQAPEDPLKPGKTLDKAILDGRLYFLDFLQIRTKRVRGEWRHLVDKIRPRIEEWIRASHQDSPGSSFIESPTAAESESITARIEERRVWAARAIKIITRLMQFLSSYSTQYGVFHSQRSIYFGGVQSSAQLTLQIIHDEFLRLEALNGELNALRDWCQNFRKECQSELQDIAMTVKMKQSRAKTENAEKVKNIIEKQCGIADAQSRVIQAQHDITKRQMEVAEYSKATATVTLVMTLITMVIGVFAIPKESNFFSLDPHLFPLLVIAVGLVAFVIQASLVDPKRSLKFLNTILGVLWDVAVYWFAYSAEKVMRFREATQLRDSEQASMQDNS